MLRSLGLAIGVIALASCSSATSFLDSSNHIKEINATGDMFNVRLEIPYSGVPGETVSSLDNEMRIIARGLADGWKGPTADSKTVSLDVRFIWAGHQDRFGNYSVSLADLKSAGDRRGSINFIDGFEPGSGETVNETLNWCLVSSPLADAYEPFCSGLLAGKNTQIAKGL